MGYVNIAIAVLKTANDVLFSANNNDIVLYISEDWFFFNHFIIFSISFFESL